MKQYEKLKAQQLRQSGESVADIARTLSVSRSTASLWVREVPLDQRAQEKIKRRVDVARVLASKTHNRQREKRERSSLEHARSVLGSLMVGPSTALVAASLLYECEGAKTSKSTLEFTNSDPVLVSIFFTSSTLVVRS